MTTVSEQVSSAVTADIVEADLLRFIESRTKTPVEPDVDLFESGMFSSLFAMELVAQLEQSYGVVIFGSDLAMENFRTVQAMTSLVLRLRGVPGGRPPGSVPQAETAGSSVG